MFGFNKEELKTLKSLNTSRKIQDFINRIPMNFETEGETCYSPRMVLLKNTAHCMEGAMLATAALRLQGQKPLVMDLAATKKDFDHVVALFQRNGLWGAISKTNHAVLRYRDPVYRNIRELAMSFFHEYFDDDGRKNLRSYSLPVNLARFDNLNWIATPEPLWEIPGHLANVKHFPILTRGQISQLRRADKVELDAGDVVEWKNPENKKDN